MLTFRKLVKNEELYSFINGFASHVKVTLPLSYVETGIVIGAFHENKMVGGFMLQSGKHLRVLNFIPSETQKLHEKFLSKYGSNLVEGNGFWLNMASKRASYEFWKKIRKETLKTKAKYILLGVDGNKTRLKKMYSTFGLLERILFTGEVKLDSGQLLSDNYVIAVSSMRKLKFAYVLRARHIFWKFILRPRKTNLRLKYEQSRYLSVR